MTGGEARDPSRGRASYVLALPDAAAGDHRAGERKNSKNKNKP
jgi:hypothetical protein